MKSCSKKKAILSNVQPMNSKVVNFTCEIEWNLTTTEICTDTTFFLDIRRDSNMFTIRLAHSLKGVRIRTLGRVNPWSLYSLQ